MGQGLRESKPLEYPASTRLYNQGRYINEVFRLEQGLVNLSTSTPAAVKPSSACRPKPGTILGAYCAILEKACISIDLVTKSTLSRISAEQFCGLLQTDINMSWHQHLEHSKLLAEQITKVAQLGCYSVQRRLEMLLCELIRSLDLKVGENGVRMNMPLKYWEVAQLIAVSPEHPCRVFKSLETQGILQRKKGWIIIPDPEKLAPPKEGIPSSLRMS